MSPRRPEDFLTLMRQSRRGRIKLYLGFAAGVGKTCRMLQEAHTLHVRGVDVVVGWAETHGRADTAALLAGLEVVPPRRVSYRTLQVEEMDLPAILARKPEVVIVDELPHTNPPDSPHRWRYQDVEALSDAGIHVITAMNVQHLASLQDVVLRVTGVRVRETVPDTFLSGVDQVVSVDITAEDLRERLMAGQIYPKERVQTALDSFFTPENLEALRELALREVAESLDRRHLARGENLNAGKVMVCIGAKSPNARLLIERGARIAGRLNTHWLLCNVRAPDERLDSAEERIFLANLELAQRMGAEVIRLCSADIVGSLLATASSKGVDLLVVGRSLRPRWRELWDEGPITRLLRAAGDRDVLLIN